MKSLILLGVLGLALAGCNVNLNPSIATPSQVDIAINSFDAAEVTATNYLRLPLCSVAGVQVCRTQAASQSVYTAVKSGRVARDQLTADLAANASAPVTLLQSLTTAVSTLQSIAAQQ